jgi:transmembrane sensor
MRPPAPGVNQPDSGIWPRGRQLFREPPTFDFNGRQMPANDIEFEAANWLIRLERDPSAQLRADFSAWVAGDPRNHAAFIRLEETWSRADILKRLRPLDGAVDEQVLNKFARPAPGLDLPRKRKPPLLVVIAALVVVAVGATTGIVVLRSGWQVYETDFGGFQRVALADGSTAMLNTDSRIRARMRSGRRQIVLDRGEALFTVAHDARRPFDVAAGDTVVRAVGTVFAVRLRDARQVDVIITEGRVAIDPPDDSPEDKLPQPPGLPATTTLAPGETVSVKDHRLHVQKIDTEQVTHKLAWTQGRIWFDRATLAEAVAEFNRYNRRQLVIDDPRIAGLPLGGAFDATGLDSFVAALRTLGVRAVATRSEAGDPASEVISLVGAASHP